jgi:hypothetical protein
VAKGPVETAHPQQYLRLLLMRLLETQRCLKPLLGRPEMAEVRRQFQENVYILSEIESWLKANPADSPLGPSLSSARGAASSGDEYRSQDQPTTDTSRTSQPSPFAWHIPKEVPSSPSQVRSSLPSGTKLPDSAEISNGRITFQPSFLRGKPKGT